MPPIERRSRKHLNFDVSTFSAHLLGHMNGVLWTTLGSWPEVKPFPSKASVDLTEEMRRRKWTARTIAEKGDQFLQSMGMPAMTEVSILALSIMKFYSKSILDYRF